MNIDFTQAVEEALAAMRAWAEAEQAYQNWQNSDYPDKGPEREEWSRREQELDCAKDNAEDVMYEAAVKIPLSEMQRGGDRPIDLLLLWVAMNTAADHHDSDGFFDDISNLEILMQASLRKGEQPIDG
jgi:hypothetical protein